MACRLPLKSIALAAWLCAGAAGGASAATNEELLALVEKLSARLQVLEQQQTVLNKSLETETISETEPALSARLKAVETQAQELVGPVGKLKAFEGMTGGLSLTMAAQKSFGSSVADSQLGYRADAFVNLPLAPIGDIEQSVFVQFRLGQGAGLGLPSYSKPNATAFQLQGGLRADDSVALLAQAWYQARISLLWGGFKSESK